MIRFIWVAMVIATAFIPQGSFAQTDKDAARLDRRARIEQCRTLIKESIEAIDGTAYDSALVLLDQALTCDPKNPDAFFHTARILLALRDTTGAVDTLAAGVRKAPLSSRLKLLLARLKLARSELAEAGDLVDGVLAIKPNEGEALYLKGLTLLRAGDSTAAVTTWQKALAASLAKQVP